MRIPKRYGQSKIDKCPFCDKIALLKNSQDIPVCSAHKTAKLDDIKCSCGKWLEILIGKWGPYFRCCSCGNINFKRAIEMNPPAKREQKTIGKKISPKETVLTSDELDLM